MLEKRALVVINPRAGRGGGGQLPGILRASAQRAGWAVEVRTTEHPGHEVELGAAAVAERWPLVIAVGGDGTVHGVANGMLRSSTPSPVLGFVPLGTGNDFAKTVGLDRTRHPERNLTRILGGTVRHFDVGRVRDEYFVNSCGVGFGPEVVRHTSSFKRLRGFSRYLAAVFRAFVTFRAPHLDIATREHSERGRLLMLEIAIGKTAGGGFRLTPDADPADGLFDVCLIREIGKWTFLQSFASVLRGTHGRLDQVKLFQTARVTVTGPGAPLALHLDGELRHAEEATAVIEILPGRLRVLCAQT